jgi:hypothetical protein
MTGIYTWLPPEPDDYISKPIEFAKFMEIVKKNLKKR